MSINKELYFDDLQSFWACAFRESEAYEKSSRTNRDLQWYGGLSWPEAKAMAQRGWQEGMQEIEKYRAMIVPRITEKVLRAEQTYAMAGYHVDVGAFLANQPECFVSRVVEERNYPGRIFKIVCSVSVSAKVTPEIIIQRGAMVCALIDAIEFAGHRAEVIANSAMSAGSNQSYRQGKHKSSGWFEVSVMVKKPNQPLAMSDLAFCLVHPAMLRRMMFSAAEQEGWSDFARNYGYPAEATDQGEIYIKEIFSGMVSNEAAIGWVLEQLKQLEIDIVLEDH